MEKLIFHFDFIVYAHFCINLCSHTVARACLDSVFSSCVYCRAVMFNIVFPLALAFLFSFTNGASSLPLAHFQPPLHLLTHSFFFFSPSHHVQDSFFRFQFGVVCHRSRCASADGSAIHISARYRWWRIRSPRQEHSNKQERGEEGGGREGASEWVSDWMRWACDDAAYWLTSCCCCVVRPSVSFSSSFFPLQAMD